MFRKLIFCLTIFAIAAGGCTKEQIVKSLKKIPVVKDIPKIKLPKPKPTPRATSQTLDGEAWSLDDRIGKVIVISFWSTDCPESMEWQSWLKDIHEKFAGREDFIMVGVAVDEDAEAVKEYCRKNNMSWTQLHEPGKRQKNGLSNLLKVKFTPSVWIIHKNKEIERLVRRGDRVVKALQRKPIIQVNLEDMTIGTELATW